MCVECQRRRDAAPERVAAHELQRAKLRQFFEVNRHFVTIAALAALADKQVIARSVVRDAMVQFGIDPEKANPRLA